MPNSTSVPTPYVSSMSRYPVSAIERSSEVVEVLLERGGAGATEVADALDLPKSTVHDHLKTLAALDYVVNEGGTYRPSMKFLHVGKAARESHELFVNGREAALSLSERLDDQYVQLVTEENDHGAVLLATGWGDATRPPGTPQTYPTYVHLHSNAPGKAILSCWDDDAVRTLAEERGLPARTPDTITDVEGLLETLQAVREDGFAVDEGELISGMTGVAVPVVTDEGVHGAIAAYGSAGSLPERLAGSDLLAQLLGAADGIEADLIFAAE